MINLQKIIVEQSNVNQLLEALNEAARREGDRLLLGRHNEHKGGNERMKMEEDAKVFGEDQWVYCRQHMKPHTTGWCSVSVNDKIGLGISGNYRQSEKAAYEKCREWNLPIYGENAHNKEGKEGIA